VTDEPRTRVAVVGTGPWRGREHARVYSERADVDLCAVVGRNRERTERRAREFGANPYVDIDEMLERERPDLVRWSRPWWSTAACRSPSSWPAPCW
jgi:myo-inositol 2-dehydrogenase/D-chiro-inositol 1-dehydrogenase